MIILKKYLSRFEWFGYAHQPWFGQAHQPSSSIFRYLGLTSVFIIGSQVLFGTGQVYSNYRQKLNNLETRVEDTANFFGEVKKESQIPINARILARLLTQASLKEDLLYAKAAPSLSPANSSTAEEILGGKRMLVYHALIGELSGSTTLTNPQLPITVNDNN